jgi:hypothetical protein
MMRAQRSICGRGLRAKTVGAIRNLLDGQTGRRFCMLGEMCLPAA